MTEIVKCPKCGTIYELKKHHSPSRDKDSIECYECGETIISWNGGLYYTVESKQKENKEKED